MIRSGQYLSKNQISCKIYTVFQLLRCGNLLSFFFHQNSYLIFQVLAGGKEMSKFSQFRHPAKHTLLRLKPLALVSEWVCILFFFTNIRELHETFILWYQCELRFLSTDSNLKAVTLTLCFHFSRYAESPDKYQQYRKPGFSVNSKFQRALRPHIGLLAEQILGKGFL